MVEIVNWKSGAEVLRVNSQQTCMSFSPHGRRLALGTAGPHPTITVFDVGSGRQVLSLKDMPSGIGVYPSAVQFSPDGRRLAAAIGPKALVWDANTGRLELTLVGHSAHVRSVCFSPDGGRLATTSEMTASIWDAQEGREILSLQGHHSWIQAVCFSSDGRRLAAPAS